MREGGTSIIQVSRRVLSVIKFNVGFALALQIRFLDPRRYRLATRAFGWQFWLTLEQQYLLLPTPCGY